MTVCEGGSGSSYGTMTFSGVQLYRVDIEDGFALQGGVSHPYVDPYSSAQYALGGACSNWWTQASSIVKRSVFMDDFVYSISDRRVKVSDLRELSQEVADVPLQAE